MRNSERTHELFSLLLDSNGYLTAKKYQRLEQSLSVNLLLVEKRNKRLLLIFLQKVKESEAFNQFYISANVRHHDKHIIKKIVSEYHINLIIKNYSI